MIPPSPSQADCDVNRQGLTPLSVPFVCRACVILPPPLRLPLALTLCVGAGAKLDRDGSKLDRRRNKVGLSGSDERFSAASEEAEA